MQCYHTFSFRMTMSMEPFDHYQFYRPSSHVAAEMRLTTIKAHMMG